MKRFLARGIALYLVIAGLGGALVPASALASGEPFYALNVLPMPSGTDGWIVGGAQIDDAGDVTAGATDTGGFAHVLVWPAGGAAVQPAAFGRPEDLTHDGVFLYWDNSDGQLHQYTIATSAVSQAVSVLTGVAAMNAASPRMTVGTYLPQNSQIVAAGEAPLGSTNTNEITDLGFGIDSGAADINDAGDVAGYGPCTTSSSCAYVYDHTTHSATVIGPDGTDATATMQGVGINASGEVIGNSWFNGGFNRRPFIYTMVDGVTFLGTGTSSTGFASAINGAGNVAGSVDGPGAVLWLSGSTDPITLNTRVVQTNLTNWNLSSATGINDDGLIVASGSLDGQSRIFLLTPVEDNEPPTSTGTLVDGSGTLATPNGAGWYNDDTLKLHLQVADNEGGFGLGSLTLSVNGSSSTRTLNRNGQSLDALTFGEGTTSVSYYATDLAGNAETAHNLTVKYDKTAPTWSCDDVPTGWVSGDLTLSCHASDDVSGLDANSPAAFTLSTSLGPNAESADVSTSSQTLCDVAGNCVDAQQTGLMIDNKAPVVSCGQLDSEWHANDVAVDCSASDGGSGLASSDDDQFSLTTSVPAGTETDTATTNSRNVCDAVDNCVTAGPFSPAKVDKKAPTLSGAPMSAPNGNGWYNTPVEIHWSCADGGSGVSACPDDQSIATEGTNQTVTQTVSDNVGNSTTATSSPPVSIDRTAPTVSYSGNQGSYQIDQVVNIHCSASDNLSGIESSTCVDISGPAYSFAVGSNQFSATATDYAGNTGSGSVSFTIGVTPESLCVLTKQFTGNSRTASRLCVPLNGLSLAEARHDARMKASLINTYVLLVNAQRGLTNQERTTLVRLANDL